jgi:hypothetical protein
MKAQIKTWGRDERERREWFWDSCYSWNARLDFACQFFLASRAQGRNPQSEISNQKSVKFDLRLSAQICGETALVTADC